MGSDGRPRDESRQDGRHQVLQAGRLPAELAKTNLRDLDIE
jgi:hypothetical protein